jgi:DNA-binding response OmpR family regulator
VDTRILIVEDDRDIAALVERYLSRAGYATEVATSGRDVVESVSRRPPAAMVLDLMLPDMDGLTICRALRAQPATAELPIIVLTARNEEADRVIGLELGADDYITKPFSPRELVARVKAVLRRSHRSAP